MDDVIFDIQDLISFNISLDGVGITNLAINETLTDDTRFINLYGEDKIRMTIANFTGGISGQYSYVSDPPILADIGDINFNSESFGLVIDGHNYYEDGHL